MSWWDRPDQRWDRRAKLDKGTAITCEAGHVVFTLRRALSPGRVVEPDNMDNRQPGFALHWGDHMGACRECGSDFNYGLTDNDSAVLHTELGWWPYVERLDRKTH